MKVRVGADFGWMLCKGLLAWLADEPEDSMENLYRKPIYIAQRVASAANRDRKCRDRRVDLL